LIGVVAFSPLGAASVVFYLAAYIATNLLAFGIVMAVSRIIRSDNIKDYSGLSRRNPGLALMMLAAFLSLAGMPPFGGFVRRSLSSPQACNQVMSGWSSLDLEFIIGVYYYLNVMKYVYLYRMPNEDEEKHPIPLTVRTRSR